MIKKMLYSILLLSCLAACGVPERGPAPTVENGIVVPTEPPAVGTPSATIPIAPPPETIEAPTLALNPTATSDLRLPPERWQEWPIVPAVTQRAIEIYRNGQSMSLDGHAFSKVGDCQSVKAAFMGYFDIPERYSLGSDYAYLQQAIDNFSGHFNTDGQAVKGGFNAAAVLSPLWADPNVCLAGEDPLECELRVTKPIIVIVSLEVWWDGRTPEQYENLMRRILDTIITHGAVPILATKADNVEGDNSLNLTTARLANEYDLPLWNFWAAVQPLPAHGMDMNRKDGFHISTEAWNIRSFTGLQALDSVWRGLLNAAHQTEATRIATEIATPAVTATTSLNLGPTSTLPAGITSKGGSGLIVFGLAQRQGEGYTYPGVYTFNMGTLQTSQIFGDGVRFQSASPDGKYLLTSEGLALYRSNAEGTDRLKLTDSLYAFGNTDAIWLPDGRIAAVITKDGGTTIVIISGTGTVAGELPASEAFPLELYPGSTSDHIFWEGGTCSAPGVCQRDGAWVTSLDGKLNQTLNGLNGPSLTPGSDLLASADASPAAKNTVVFSAADGTGPHPYPLPGDLLADYAWSPAGDMLAAVMALRSDYSGKVLGNRNFLIDPKTLVIREFPQSNLLNPRVFWSPDGTHLFWMGTRPDEIGYKVGGSLVDLDSKQVINLDDAIRLAGPDYLVVTNAEWLAFP